MSFHLRIKKVESEIYEEKKPHVWLGLLLKVVLIFFLIRTNAQPQILILQGFLPYKGKVD